MASWRAWMILLLVVPVGEEVGLGEDLVEGLVRGGMLLQIPLVVDLVEDLVDGQLEGRHAWFADALDVVEVLMAAS